MITNFKIFEGRGISDLIKQYSTIIYDYFSEGEDKILLDFDYKPLPLMDLRIIFKKSNVNHAFYNLDFSSIDENYKLNNIIIEIEYSDSERSNIAGMIIHELNHINEYYNIQLKMLKTKIKIKPTWIDIQISIKELDIPKENTYYYFIYLLYLSLDTEMNARISQVYDYLYQLNIKDSEILFQKLKNHKNWEYVKLLENFDSVKFVNQNIIDIGEESLLKITNELIGKFKDKDLNKRTKLLNFIKIVNDKSDLYSLYDNFSKYFKTKTKKHIKKFKELTKEIVEDLNGNKPFNEICRINKDMKL